MITRSEFQKLANLLTKAQKLVQTAIAGIDLPTPGKPPKPVGPIREAIWLAWEKLESRAKFTWRDVKVMAKPYHPRSRYYDYYDNSYFTPILKQLVLAGYLEVVHQGSGQRPTEFKVRK